MYLSNGGEHIGHQVVHGPGSNIILIGMGFGHILQLWPAVGASGRILADPAAEHPEKRHPGQVRITRDIPV